LTAKVLGVARRMTSRLTRECEFIRGDIYVDVTIHSLVSDLEGLTRMALEAIGSIGEDPELKGVHIIGGMTNIGTCCRLSSSTTSRCGNS
jgi:5-methyltetrahydrofolate--homocysteine methyltransferase